MQWREFRFARREECAVCGTRPTITSQTLLAAGQSGRGALRPLRLKPRQLQARLAQRDEAASAMAIVDVREPREFSAGHLPGAVNIPLAELSERLGEIPPQAFVVFVCRSGNRSQSACELAARAGRAELADLEGGMLAWAAMINPAMTIAPFR